MVFGLFASMIAMWFSRHREFRADAGGATLAGRDKMVAALERLAQNHGQSTLPKQVQAFGISGGDRRRPARLLMSHPPLDERIAALRNCTLDGQCDARGRGGLRQPSRRNEKARRSAGFFRESIRTAGYSKS